MASPYNDSAGAYLEQGLAVIPCGPGTKFPGRYTAAEGWWKAHDWQKYCDRLPTDFEVQIWDRWPDAGVCLALGASSAPAGKILVAIDIDTDDAGEVAAIRSVLPGSPVSKRGAKGETQFYLANPCVKNQPFNDANKRRLLDLLAHGRQTVLPPTVHPDCQHCGAKGKVSGADMSCSECGTTGIAYRWLTPDTLADFDVADLPVLPDDIAEQIGKALAPFGYVEPAPLAAGSIGNADLGIEAPHRALNDAALANLDAWVPDLKLYKCKKVGAGYKAVADWRPSSSGRPDAQRATNLAIRYDGIKDCGENKGYTPLDLVMAATVSDLETAFRWLQERVAPSTPMLISSNPTPRPDPVREQMAAKAPGSAGMIPNGSKPGNLAGLRLATFEGAPVADASLGEDRANLPAVIEEPALPAVPGPEWEAEAAGHIIPPHLCTPPGLLGEIVEWINHTARTPVPQHNLGAAVAFLGAIMGRRWEGPTRLRTNFYCLNVAGSGFGKEHPLDACRTLALAAGLDNFLGAEETKSDSALRKLLEAYPTRVLFMDEFGGFMKKILARNAPAHEARTRDLLLTFFSRAKGDYLGSEGASEKAVKIANPNLNICGSTTPADLWAAFSSASTADGLLPRFLVFEADGDRPLPVRNPADVSDVPRSLVKALHAILDIRPIGNIATATNGKVQPIRAAWGPGALEHFEALAGDMLAAGDRDGEKAPIYSRVAEHALKLALVYAVGINPRSPMIDLPALTWAQEIVEISTAGLIKAIEGRVADNDDQAAYLDVLSRITAAGPFGIVEAALTKKLRGKYNKRRLDDIIGLALHGGEIWREIRTGPKGGRPGLRIGRKLEVEEAS